MAKTIIIEVAQNGSLTIEASGFIGKACTDITKQLGKALGTVEKEGLKNSYFNEKVEHVTIKSKR